MKISEYNNQIWRVICLLLATFSIMIFWRDTVVISIILFLLAILINIKSKKFEIFFYIIVAILATFVESVSISTGAWIYSSQHIFNFPIWLPLYWGMGGVVMKDVYLLIKEINKQK